MALTLSPEQIDRALGQLGERAVDAEVALYSFGWDGESPLRILRHDLMSSSWYELPAKFIAPIEAQRDVAEALAEFLDRAGAGEHAALCRAPEVESMLELWDDDRAAARTQLGELLAASGLEPPDTELLAWGSVMGPVEAEAHDRAIEALEDDAQTAPADMVAVVLREPAGEGVLLDAIHGERLDYWLRRGSPERAAIIDAVADLLASPVRVEADAGIEPALWLLERGEAGIALTQTGALARDLVRQAVELRPQWWNAELFGPPNREAEVAPLEQLHALLREMRLLRRSGRLLRTTPSGRRLRAEPDALLAACAESLLAGERFEHAVAELTAALLLAGEPASSDALTERVHAAVAADGWRCRAASRRNGWTSPRSSPASCCEPRRSASSSGGSSFSLRLVAPRSSTGCAPGRSRPRVRPCEVPPQHFEASG